MSTTIEVWEPARRIEQLIGELEAFGDPHVVALARDLVQSVMELHGAGLERILEIVSQAGAAGQAAIDSFGRDELVSSLLVLYGLHPVPLETRVRRALEKSRLAGGTAELVGMEEGVVRVRVTTSGCGSSDGSFGVSVEEIIRGAAPDITGLVIEGGAERTVAGFVPLEKLTGSREPKAAVAVRGAGL